MLSTFKHKPSQARFDSELNFGIWYEKNIETKWLGFCNSDWTICMDVMKSSLGSAFPLDSGVIARSSKKQQTVIQLSAGAEYV